MGVHMTNRIAMRPDENQKLQIRFGSKSHRRHREPRGGYSMIDKSYDYFSEFINIKFYFT
jgi:hypothetical protein